jgi:uncharacterized membrane protein YfcA
MAPAADLWHAPHAAPSPSGDVILDPLFYLLAIPAVTLLGLGKGGFAGIGMISTPLLALAIPPLQAVAILLPILLCQDVISVWIYRRNWSAWNLKVLLPGAIVGVGAAWLFASYFSNAWIELAVGAIGLSFVAYTWIGLWLGVWLGRPAPAAWRPNVLKGVLWGSLAGFTSTLVQVGAPPYQVHILPQRLDKLTFVGTTIIFFALVNVMKVVPYFALGQFSMRNLATSVTLLPLAIATNFLGIWLMRRTPQELFYRISYWLLFFISVALIWEGAAELLRAPR